MLVQVKDEVTEEERGQDDKVDESDQRKQRTAEVGGQSSCCPKLLLYGKKKNTFPSPLIKT
jgi:hypothetical protein